MRPSVFSLVAVAALAGMVTDTAGCRFRQAQLPIPKI